MNISDLVADRFRVVAVKIRDTDPRYDAWDYLVERDLLERAHAARFVWVFHAHDEAGRQVIKAKLRRGK